RLASILFGTRHAGERLTEPCREALAISVASEQHAQACAVVQALHTQRALPSVKRAHEHLDGRWPEADVAAAIDPFQPLRPRIIGRDKLERAQLIRLDHISRTGNPRMLHNVR